MATDSAPVFDFETFLKSDDFASLYNANKSYTDIVRTTGSLSTIASICMIVHILRSHHGLSTTYHRLVFGLAIGDILLSFFGYGLGTVMAPKEYGYIASGAMGNQATCDAQGFLQTFGGLLGLFYNSSICFYYLAIVTFNKKDNYIRTKLEPWLHGISIFYPLAIFSAIFAVNGYNSTGKNCWFEPNSGLPHCMGLESGEIRDGFTIPCGRGDGKEHPTLHSVLFALVFSGIVQTLVVTVVTMALMYRTVHKAEKKMQKYGVGALRIRKTATKKHLEKNTNGNDCTNNAGPCGSPPAHPQDEDSGKHCQFSLIQWFKANCAKVPCMDSCCSSERNNLRSTSAIVSQKRAILHRAVGYVTAWGLSWIPLLLPNLIGESAAIYYIIAFSNPFQGVFNFIAYMLPKVRNAKKGPTKKRSRVKHGRAGNGNHVNTITWRQAFLKAYMSRGPKKTSWQQSARSNGSSNGAWRSTILTALKKMRSSISTISRQPTNKKSNDTPVVNINQHQEIHPPLSGCSGQGENIALTADAPPPAKYNNDNESPAPTLEKNVHASSPPLVLSEDADDLKEEDEGVEHHFDNNNDTESMNNEDMGEVLDGIYLSEEIQSILE